MRSRLNIARESCMKACVPLKIYAILTKQGCFDMVRVLPGHALTKVCLRLECLSKTCLWYSIQSPLTTTTTTTRICTWMSVQDPLLRSITSAKPGLCSARGTTEIKYLREECECEVSFLGWKIVSRKYQLTTDEEDQTVSLWVTDYFTHYSLYWPRKYMGLFSSFRII